VNDKRFPKLEEQESVLLQYADRFYIRRFPEKEKEEHELSKEASGHILKVVSHPAWPVPDRGRSGAQGHHLEYSVFCGPIRGGFTVPTDGSCLSLAGGERRGSVLDYLQFDGCSFLMA
jgi:hypothetical protein